jgi:hypothetical protein
MVQNRISRPEIQDNLVGGDKQPTRAEQMWRRWRRSAGEGPPPGRRPTADGGGGPLFTLDDLRLTVPRGTNHEEHG